jgi:pimeloyl-ACP methyl ester carboxylesterase
VSDEIELRGGGAVAVDTETLRHTALRFDRIVDDLERLGTRFAAARATILDQRGHGWAAVGAAAAFSRDLVDAVGNAQSIAQALRHAAAVYEIVELNAERSALWLAGDREGMYAVDRRRNELHLMYPGALQAASMASFERGIMWPSFLARQATETGFDLGSIFSEMGGAIGGVALGGATIAAAATFGIGGWGRLSREARLGGDAPPVSVRALEQSRPSRTDRAPADLAQIAARMPGSGESRVRVEKYTMPDGTEQFAVYIAGTQSAGIGGADPWDIQSNAELYTGSRSASYEATLAALEAAGANPGDTVHAFGHSQGAMIAAHLALESEYDITTVVSFGSPVEADVGSETLSVAIRHSDDPVAIFAGGGHEGAVGAPGSFTAEREAHAESGPVDATAPAHAMGSYAETAAMVDALTDPRVAAAHDVLAGLREAETVEVTEYTASRPVGPAPSPVPAPSPTPSPSHQPSASGLLAAGSMAGGEAGGDR